MGGSAARGYPDFLVRRWKSDERRVKQVFGDNKNIFLSKRKRWLCQQENTKKESLTLEGLKREEKRNNAGPPCLDYTPCFSITILLSLWVTVEYCTICFMRSRGYETTGVDLYNTCRADSLKRVF